MNFSRACHLWIVLPILLFAGARDNRFEVHDGQESIHISTELLEAKVAKSGYVSGIKSGTFLDKSSGFRDAGHGLSIADFVLESGSDEAYRESLHPHLRYEFGNLVHGDTPKKIIEGPQICTRAKSLDPQVIRGEDFVAIRQSFEFPLSAPGYRSGSIWEQILVFPEGERFYISSQSIRSVNASPGIFFRIDMPGHIKHDRGSTFSKVYLSYFEDTNSPERAPGGLAPAEEFFENFPPDAKFNYRRDRVTTPPKRFIRAYKLRNPATGEEGPWLAGMTLDPGDVHEAWCHQRGYVSMIEEFGGRPIQPGEKFSAAFLVGYFDSVQDMEKTYDRFSGHSSLEVSQEGWKLIP